MAIATVIVIGNMLYVKDKHGMLLFTKSFIGSQLLGYTGSTVTIRIGRMAYVYDERGRTLSTMPV